MSRLISVVYLVILLILSGCSMVSATQNAPMAPTNLTIQSEQSGLDYISSPMGTNLGVEQ